MKGSDAVTWNDLLALAILMVIGSVIGITVGYISAMAFP